MYHLATAVSVAQQFLHATIYYGMSCVSSMLLHSTEPRPSGLKTRIYNPLCDTDEDSINDRLNEELDIDSDDEMKLKEKLSEELSKEMSESESEI
jgi:hypothetical protein